MLYHVFVNEEAIYSSIEEFEEETLSKIKLTFWEPNRIKAGNRGPKEDMKREEERSSYRQKREAKSS